LGRLIGFLLLRNGRPKGLDGRVAICRPKDLGLGGETGVEAGASPAEASRANAAPGGVLEDDGQDVLLDQSVPCRAAGQEEAASGAAPRFLIRFIAV
jgi:hypothetical protein